MLSVLSEICARQFEQVAFYQSPVNGIVGIVAVHNTVLGPGLGGIRMHNYSSLEEALIDVLNLSEGMTFKNSLAGLNLGGGKSVIIAERSMKNGRQELFEDFGHFVQALGGRYWAAEDLGTSVRDVSSVAKNSQFVAGKDPKTGGGGDPSPWTALGVFQGMRAALERVYGSDSFVGKRVAIQGVGNVGTYLAKHLADAGASLILSDVRETALDEACKKFSAKKVKPEEILFAECDILSPCAMGGIISKDALAKLSCRIIAGGANNQILGAGKPEGEAVEQELTRRKILYVPDFAINAGGVILCGDELEPGGYTETRVRERVMRIYKTVGEVLDTSRQTGITPASVAVRIAKATIAERKQTIGSQASSNRK